MASPQLENGHLRIANDLYEAILAYPLSKREILVVLAIIRLTYGYGKKADTITHYQIAKLSGLRRDRIPETVATLSEKHVLTVHKSGTIIRGQEIDRLGVNKNYDQWVTVPKTGTVHKTGTPQNGYGDRTQNGGATVPKSSHSKDNTIQRQKDSTRSAKRMAESWEPDQRGLDYVTSYGVTIQQAAPIIHEFHQYWLGRSTKRKDWTLAFMRNSRVEGSLVRLRDGGNNGNQRQGNRAEEFHEGLQRFANEQK